MGANAAAPAIIAVAKDPKAELSVRLQAVRQLGTHPAAGIGRAADRAAAKPRRFAAVSRRDCPGAHREYLQRCPRCCKSSMRTISSPTTRSSPLCNRIGRANPKAWPLIVKG